MLKKPFIIALLLGVGLTAFGQFERAKFLKTFYTASFKEKVKLLSETPYTDLQLVEPLLKDSIIQLKKQVYAHSASKEPRFLFDLIDLNREDYHQNFYKTIFICENSLQNHSRDLNDSLKLFAKLIGACIKTKNINRVFEVNSILEKNRARIPKDVYSQIITQKSKLYSILGLPQEAIKYRRKEEKQKVNHSDETRVSFYNDIGVYFNKLKQPDSAIHFFEKGRKILEPKLKENSNNLSYQFTYALIGGNIAFAFTLKNLNEPAIPLLKSDINYSLQTKNYESAANSYLLLIRCYLQLKQLNMARFYLDTTEKIINTIDEPDPKLTLERVRAEYYKIKGEESKAYNALNNYVVLKDSLNSIEKEKQLLTQQVSLDLFTKERELLDKEKIIEEGKLSESKQKTFRAYLISGVFMLIAIIVFLFLNNNLSKTREAELQIKNEQIVRQNKQIELALKEKEVLIKEIHHRVKNNLQIISSILNLQADKNNHPEISIILKDAQQRIASMALTHQMLYQKSTLSTVGMKEYVETLIKQISGSFELPNIKLETNIACENRVMDLDTAIPLGLLINELMTNAFKHAFVGRESGLISVSLKNTLKDCHLIIKDNGVGLPADAEKTGSSLGMELIHILVEQLNCELHIERGEGTSFKIVMREK